MTIQQRKDDHIRINLEEDVGFLQLTTGLERVHFVHQALPEVNMSDIDISLNLFGKHVAAPILVSSMTGGTDKALQINRHLAEAAEACQLAMGVGSQRASLMNPDSADSFRVRSVAPSLLLFANIGAVQLNYGFHLDHCIRAVEMIEADGLILHLNPLQEVFQVDGDLNWAGLLEKIHEICYTLSVPIIVKEVGWGISREVAEGLMDAGVSAIDVAGAGGTSWSQVEMYRAPTERLQRLGHIFRDWGISTVESLRTVVQVRQQKHQPNLSVFASGGIRNGLDIAKCVALGASLVGLASPFLRPAVESSDAVVAEMELLTEELQIAMFCTGSSSLKQLRRPHLYKLVDRYTSAEKSCPDS
ncbi:MAG: type 2 isopentenyl-diphosphate Delta-isomerase [Chloroflexota bacterium]